MKWITMGFGLFIIFLVVQAGRGQFPAVFSYFRDFPGGDLLGHFLLMGVLTFLVAFTVAMRSALEVRAAIIGSVAVMALLITLEEASQILLVHRSFSFLDLFSDYAGVLFFGSLAFLAARRRRSGLEADPSA